jgi:hypothetical protein
VKWIFRGRSSLLPIPADAPSKLFHFGASTKGISGIDAIAVLRTLVSKDDR